MYSALSLENLAKTIHTDKEQRFAQANFAYQIEQTQDRSLPTPWWQGLTPLRHITMRQLVVMFVICPLHLVGQLG